MMPTTRTQSSVWSDIRIAAFAGTGSYVPPKVLTNAQLSERVDTSDEWITTRTGIKERRIATEAETTTHMATEAAQRALASAGIEPGEIDLIIVATITADKACPSAACEVQKQLGALNAVCFDVAAACSGFLFALENARQWIASGRYDNALVIAADRLSDVVDWTDRNTCVLFGDGAGAAVLTASPHGRGIVSTSLGSDGRFGSHLEIGAENSNGFLRMNGRETFKQAIQCMAQSIDNVLFASGLRPEDIACVVPHQANIRILQALAEKLEMPFSRFFTNLDRYGNTSGASCAIALDEAHREGRFQEGDHILLAAFGGGLTYGATLVQW